MVAKIGRGESLYGALIYNYDKVGQQTARIIAGHRMVRDVANIPQNAMQQMMLSFEDYLAANRRTDKPILHISLNPSPQDTLSDGQFATLAADYMERMGYGDQPYVVFLHEDTGRRHIHIVTTCVDEHGKKISSAYEWKRSMAACRELEQQYGLVNSADPTLRQSEPRLNKVDYRKGDLKHQIANTLRSVIESYKFQSFGEYSALLACFHIEAKQVRGQHEGVPYTGIVYTATDDRGRAVGPPFKSSLLGKSFGHEALTQKMSRHALAFRQRKWGPTIHGAVQLAMLTCQGDRKRFERVMHGKGIDVLFRQNDQGRIYGATFIDHHAREVYNGSRLGRDFSANAFEQLFNNPVSSEPIPQQEDDLPELFGIDISGYPEPEPYDNIPKRKRKKKRRYIAH